MGIVNFSPKQDGTGDPSPTNVRPIHPGLVLKSKNLLNPDKIYDGFIWSDDTIGTDTQWHYTDYVEVTEATTYTVSGSTVTNVAPTAQFVFYDETKMKISSIHSGPSNFTFTTPNGTKYVRLSLKGDDSFQLELGSTQTEYEPYYDTEIYGGYLDVENFEIVEEWVGTVKKLSDCTEKTVEEDIISYYFNALFEDEIINNYQSQMCSISRYSWNTASLKANHFYAYYSTTAGVKGRLMLYLLPDEPFDDNAEFTVAVKLVTPIIHSLTASQLTQAYNQLVPVSSVMLNKRRRMLFSSPHIKIVQSGNTSDSAQIATFKTDMKVPIESLKVYFTPIQEGSGDPSPTNVRPISGYTGLTVKQAGVNLLQCDTFTNGSQNGIIYTETRNSDNQIESIKMKGLADKNNSFRNLNYTIGEFKLFDGIIAFNAYSNQANINPVSNVQIYAEDGTNMTTHTYAGWYIYNINQSNYTATWARIQAFPYNAKDIDFDTTVYPMMCLAQDVGCEFEPYKGIEIPISWADLGIKYGGYVDLVSGELVVTHGVYTIDENGDYEYRTGSVTYVISTVSDMERGDFYTDTYCICDMAQKVLNRTDVATTKMAIKIGNNNNKTYLYNTVQVLGIDNETDFRNYVKDNPISFTYPLETPLIYQLTPNQIKTFIGRNNIWSNAGNVEVKYWTH